MFDINLKFIIVCIFLLPVKAALHHGGLYIPVMVAVAYIDDRYSVHALWMRRSRAVASAPWRHSGNVISTSGYRARRRRATVASGRCRCSVRALSLWCIRSFIYLQWYYVYIVKSLTYHIRWSPGAAWEGRRCSSWKWEKLTQNINDRIVYILIVWIWSKIEIKLSIFI